MKTIYEQIAEFIMAQEVDKDLKSKDILEIADFIFNTQLTSVGVKKVKNELLKRDYKNLKDAKTNKVKDEAKYKWIIYLNGEPYYTAHSEQEANDIESQIYSASNTEEDFQSYYGSYPDVRIKKVCDSKVKDASILDETKKEIEDALGAEVEITFIGDSGTEFEVDSTNMSKEKIRKAFKNDKDIKEINIEYLKGRKKYSVQLYYGDWKELKDTIGTKEPLEYILEALNKEGIKYEVVEDIYGFSAPFYAEITVLDPNDVDKADDIICDHLGYAYEVVRDRAGNKRRFKVATFQEDIDSINNVDVKDDWRPIRLGNPEKQNNSPEFKSRFINNGDYTKYTTIDEAMRDMFNTGKAINVYDLAKALNKSASEVKMYISNMYPGEYSYFELATKTGNIRVKDARLTRQQKLWYSKELENIIEPQYLRKNYQKKRVTRRRRRK